MGLEPARRERGCEPFTLVRSGIHAFKVGQFLSYLSGRASQAAGQVGSFTLVR